jgi:hypothetical protein
MEASKKNLLQNMASSKSMQDLVVADHESTIDIDEAASGPRLLRVTVVSIQHLPKMDSSFLGGKCDPYVVLELKGSKFKTEVCIFTGCASCLNTSLHLLMCIARMRLH